MTDDIHADEAEVADADAAELDQQPIDRQTFAELQVLHALAVAADPTAAADLFGNILLEQEEASFDATTYVVFPLSSTVNGRTYNINLRVDAAFGDLVNRVRDIGQIMLDGVTRDQTLNFRERAKALGRLEARRSRAFGFPHSLPYRTPAPTDLPGRITEEAEVVSAAVHFALSRDAPGVDFTVNHYSKGPRNGRYWSFGSATVNLYHGSGVLRQRLNSQAMRETRASDQRWAAVMAHEMLHNLGWGHPNGSYPPYLAIEIYEWCIEAFELVEKDDILIIR